MTGEWSTEGLPAIRRALRGHHMLYDAIEVWVRDKGWRVRKAGHKYNLYPPDPGFRLQPPTFAQANGSPRADDQRAATRLNQDCRRLERAIEEEKNDRG